MLTSMSVSENTPRNNGTLAADADSVPYLVRLNPAQRQAALATEGAVLVLAGAGSGKTSMLTSRMTGLVDLKGVEPYRILAVTFTNKAAGEMRARMEKSFASELVNPARFSQSLPEVGTFHSVCVRWLRRRLDLTPFKKSFVVIDDSDQLALIKTVLKRLDYDHKQFSPRGVQSWINLAKCKGLEPQDARPETRSPFERVVLEVYPEYQRDLFAHDALDFGEILCLTYRLLRDSEEFRKTLQNQFHYVHVDEYQDTNRIQYLLLSQLVHPKHGGRGNLCVVGDEDQSIYKWRGADIRNILDFERDYPTAQIFKLEQNYRSTKTIIEAAGQIIQNNSERKPKTLWTENPAGSKISVLQFADDREEAEGVVRELRSELRTRSLSFENSALFYRTHAQSRPFEDVLRREKIPYQVVGGLRFYDRAEIKDTLAFMRLVHNPRDALSLRRIINVPTRGIGKTTVEELDRVLALEGHSDLWSLIRGVLGAADAVRPQNAAALPDRARTKLAAFVRMVDGWMLQAPSFTLPELYHRILDDTGYVNDLKKEETLEAAGKVENLEEFDNVVTEFAEYHPSLPKEQHLGVFLEEIALAASTDQEWQSGSLRMMTLHAAKGLEFDVVAVVGLEEGLLPSTQPWEKPDPSEIEEERRLCYVGFTRARTKLMVSHAQMRRIRGEPMMQTASRFLSEFAVDLTEVKGATSAQSGWRTNAFGTSRFSGSGEKSLNTSTEARTPTRTTTLDVDVKTTWVGYRVNHPSYGIGTITAEEGSGSGLKVVVEFGEKRSPVQKKFLIRFLLDMLEGSR